ncbi:MAG: winged helix DNA-binding domain-containing protein [Kibdelosporangium sp.]
MPEPITLQALNRATLARQLLLSRSDMPIPDAIEHLVGLQAQTANTWYHGLWSRLADFRPARLSDLLANREVVRLALMRSTIHLVTARDSLELRAHTQPVIERAMLGVYGKNLVGLDPAELIEVGRELLAAQPLTFSELGKRMAGHWPDRDPLSLGHAVRAWVALVQIPPRGLWGRSGQAVHSTIETFLGQEVHAKTPADKLVLRYLAAFGPASVRDAQLWSGLTRLAEVFERLRPRLVTFRNEIGAELFDLPDAPRPDAETPAPVRYLYDFDNLLLSHHDRSRVMTPERLARQRAANGMAPRCYLVDGFTRGEWMVTKPRNGKALLTLSPYKKPTGNDIAALMHEGYRLLDFAAAGADQEIRILPAS